MTQSIVSAGSSEERSPHNFKKKITCLESDEEDAVGREHSSKSSVYSQQIVMKINFQIERRNHSEVAKIISSCRTADVESILLGLPLKELCKSIPKTFKVWIQLYEKVIEVGGMETFSKETLNINDLILEIVRFCAKKDILGNNGEFDKELVSCKNILRLILKIDKGIRTSLQQREKQLRRVVTGFNEHGLLEADIKDRNHSHSHSTTHFVRLHEVLKHECEKAIAHYKSSLQRVEELAKHCDQSFEVVATSSDHEAVREATEELKLRLTQKEIEDRLCFNQSLLSAIEPSRSRLKIGDLMEKLGLRVKHDKEVLQTLSQLKKEYGAHRMEKRVFPMLERYYLGYKTVLKILYDVERENEETNGRTDSYSSQESETSSEKVQEVSRQTSTGEGQRNSIFYGVPNSDGQSRKFSLPPRDLTVSSSASSTSSRSNSESSLVELNHGEEKLTNGNHQSRSGRAQSCSNISEGGKGKSPFYEPRRQLTRSASCGSANTDECVENGSSFNETRIFSCEAIAEDVFDRDEVITELRKQLDERSTQLQQAKESIKQLRLKERELLDRLADQARRQLKRSSKFEDLSEGEFRPSQLSERYENLYSQVRLDAMDGLDEMEQFSELEDSETIKAKLLFSVVVVAFRSCQHHADDIRNKVCKLLNIPAGDVTVSLNDHIAQHMKQTAGSFNIDDLVKDVLKQLCSTLYEFPELRRCEAVLSYVREAVRLAWIMTVQTPPMAIDYNTDTFSEQRHSRFHTSNVLSEKIIYHVWPSLLEKPDGDVIHKGVVVT